VLFVVLGLEVAYGLLIPAILRDPTLGASLSALSASAGMMAFVELALGVAVSRLVEARGPRFTCALGGALVAAGALLAAGTESLPFFIFAVGVVMGAGLALAYGGASMALSFYFTTRAPAANAVSGVGGGLGVLVLNQLVGAYLQGSGGWRDCLRGVGLLCGAMVACAAALFVPVAPAAAGCAAAAAAATAAAGDASAAATAAAAAAAAAAGAGKVEGSPVLRSVSINARPSPLRIRAPTVALAPLPEGAAAFPFVGGDGAGSMTPFDLGGAGRGSSAAVAAYLRTPRSAGSAAPAPASSTPTPLVLPVAAAAAEQPPSARAEPLPQPPAAADAAAAAGAAAAAAAAAAAPLPLLSNPKFVAIAACLALFVCTSLVPEIQLGAFVEEVLPAQPELAATAYSLMGAASIAARVALAVVTFRYEVDSLLILQGCSVALGMAIGALGAHGRSPTYVALFAVAHGALTSAGLSCVSPALLELFGAEAFSAAVGLTFTLRAPLVLAAPILAGLGRELSGSFDGVWTVVGALCAASAAPICIASMKCRRLAGEK
jgi:hypothetical protein